MQEISNLTDEELNRAMIANYLHEANDFHSSADLDENGDAWIDVEHKEISVDYLNDYNLLMPLVEKHNLSIDQHYRIIRAKVESKIGRTAKVHYDDRDIGLQRAICECLLAMRLESQ